MEQIVILGLGNILYGDEGFGDFWRNGFTPIGIFLKTWKSWTAAPRGRPC
jgi:Ni,Fe-hydrogenase maturation factor